MKPNPIKKESHPAEAIASAVFVSCCRTLGSLRVPHVMSPEAPDSNPDAEYQKSLEECMKSDQPFLRDYMENPVDYVAWEDLLGRMNRISFNERRYQNLAYQHKLDLYHAALYHPQMILPHTVKYCGQVIDFLSITRSESPLDAARPFSLEKVTSWLEEMNLVTREGKNIKALNSCFETSPRLNFTGLALETVRIIAKWATGPFGPPARELPFHLVGQDNKPIMAREILFVQGMAASNETHIALLHTLPTWSNTRREILRDMILSFWIRTMEVHGDSSSFKAECAAIAVHRWQHILRYLPNIPTVQFRAKGSSAGFAHL